jgi:hypothetical protein
VDLVIDEEDSKVTKLKPRTSGKQAKIHWELRLSEHAMLLRPVEGTLPLSLRLVGVGPPGSTWRPESDLQASPPPPTKRQEQMTTALPPASHTT